MSWNLSARLLPMPINEQSTNNAAARKKLLVVKPGEIIHMHKDAGAGGTEYYLFAHRKVFKVCLSCVTPTYSDLRQGRKDAVPLEAQCACTALPFGVHFHHPQPGEAAGKVDILSQSPFGQNFGKIGPKHDDHMRLFCRCDSQAIRQAYHPCHEEATEDTKIIPRNLRLLQHGFVVC